MINLNIKKVRDDYDIEWVGKDEDPYVVYFTLGGIDFTSPKMTRKEAEAMKTALWGLTRHECQHPKVTPDFDEEAASSMSSNEVRRKWPRFSGKCPDCSFNGIIYASYFHYICGDW